MDKEVEGDEAKDGKSVKTFTIQSIEICLIEVWWCTSSGHTDYAELKEDEIKR
jgi:hypothetical protein